MPKDDGLYFAHMLDMARKAVGKTQGIGEDSYDGDENLRLALAHLVQVMERRRGAFRQKAVRRILKSPGLRSRGCVPRLFTAILSTDFRFRRRKPPTPEPFSWPVQFT
jgi:hypothetical protein